MKKILLLIALLAGAISASADSFTVGGINYTTTTDSTVEVSNEVTYTGAIVIPSSVTYSSILYNVTSIGNSAFYNCADLTSIAIPSSVASIGDYAFSECTGLTSITIPSSITSIRQGVFYHCTGLTSISIPSSVISIGNYAFQKCTSLASIAIPSSVTSIGEYSFQECTDLTSINIPSSVISIGSYAFQECASLASIAIPSSVISIGEYAFQNSKALITVSTSNLHYSSSDGILYNKNQSTIIYCPTTTTGMFTIPSTVTFIDNYAFYNCTGLTGISIPSSVTSISNGAFRECTGLISVIMPSSVISISSYAFYNCTGLTSISIPSSVASIGNYAFEGCSNLANIYSHISSPMSLVNYQFYGVNTSTCKLNVPLGAKPLYQTTLGWKDFLNIIEMVATSIDQAKATQLAVVPTIAVSTITIQTEGNNYPQLLRISNTQGQLLYETNLVENKSEVDVSSFSAGIYYIKTTDKNSRVQSIGRFIKK